MRHITRFAKVRLPFIRKYPPIGTTASAVQGASTIAIQKNTLMKVSYRKVKKGRSIEYIVFKLNDWGEPSPEWKEKMKRIDAIIKRSYGEDY